MPAIDTNTHSVVERVHERLADDVFDLLGEIAELGDELGKLCATVISDSEKTPDLRLSRSVEAFFGEALKIR